MPGLSLGAISQIDGTRLDQEAVPTNIGDGCIRRTDEEIPQTDTEKSRYRDPKEAISDPGKSFPSKFHRDGLPLASLPQPTDNSTKAKDERILGVVAENLDGEPALEFSFIPGIVEDTDFR